MLLAKSKATYGPKTPVTCIPMSDSSTEGKLLIATLNDPGVNAVTLNINNINYVSGIDFTLVARGSPAVCWTGVLTLSGLLAKTKYPWTVTQGNNEDNGTLPTLPGEGDKDFAVLGATCDNNTNHTNLSNSNPQNVPGHWQYYRNYADGVYVAGVLFVDDIGYADGTTIVDDNSSYSYPGQSGLRNDLDNSLESWLVSWCALLGMIGPSQTEYTDSELSANDNLLRALWAREEDRAWCRKNLNQWTMWGDHELLEDVGYDTEPTGTIYTNAKAAFEAFYGLIKPKLDGVAAQRDANAKHFAFSIAGIVTIAAIDGITNASRNWVPNVVPNGHAPVTAGDSAAITQFTTFFGNNQIDDIKEAINTLNSKLILLCLPCGSRYPVTRTGSTPPKPFTTVVNEWMSGTQHPLYDHCLADWQRLFTNNTYLDPLKSLMHSQKLKLITLHGDWHRSGTFFLHHDSYTNNEKESWLQVNLATIGGSIEFTSPVSKGDDVADMEVLYQNTRTPLTSNLYGNYFRWNGNYLDIKISDRNNDKLWNGKIYPNGIYGPFGQEYPGPLIGGMNL